MEEFFSDLVGITESDVNLYQEGIKEIIQTMNFSYISLFNLEDFYSSQWDFRYMRVQLEKDYAQDLSEIKQTVKKRWKSSFSL